MAVHDPRVNGGDSVITVDGDLGLVVRAERRDVVVDLHSHALSISTAATQAVTLRRQKGNGGIVGLLDKLLATGGAVLFGAIARSAYGNARETQRRKNSPLCFNDGVTQSEFMTIVRAAAKRTPRLEDVAVTGMTVTLDVRSNSGLSNWEAEIDFNDYGHLTGAYWLQTENADSLIPEHFADAVRKQIQRRVNIGSKASAQGTHATTPPPRWNPDPYPSSPPNRLRWWDGERWTEHTAWAHGQAR